MRMAGLHEILQQFSLDQFLNAFTSMGIKDTANLLSLTMQDYPTLGITSMQDRRKMFYLIQDVKKKMVDTEGVLPAESDAAFRKGHYPDKKQPKNISKLSRQSVKLRSATLPNNQKMIAVQEFSYGIPSSELKSKPKTLAHQKSKIHGNNNIIKVCVRKRPPRRAEVQRGETDVVKVNKDTVCISSPKISVDLTEYTQKFSFVFDEVFDDKSTNNDLYEKTAKPLVNAMFTEGVKATCFAYGCTGSGKTFTMLGDENIPGLYLLAASDAFSILYSGNHGNKLGLWVSFYEIYCGQLFDLLNGRSKLIARENASHKVCIAGITEKHVQNIEELMELVESGGVSRSTGSTGVNADSSRSHAILQLDLKANECEESMGRLSFIDLAGSERAADVKNSDKQTLMEGAEINQSLLALKECIRALDQDSRHTPFRQSKLTQVLKDSFVGNTRTCMIANISPNSSSCENTLNTLRYADRVKELNKDESSTVASRPATVHGNSSRKWHIHEESSPSRFTNSLKTKYQSSKTPVMKLKDTKQTCSLMALNNTLLVNEKESKLYSTNQQHPSTAPRMNRESRKGTMNEHFSFKSNTLHDLPRPETSPAVIQDLKHNGECAISGTKVQKMAKEQSYSLLNSNYQPISVKRYQPKENSQRKAKSVKRCTRYNDTLTGSISKDAPNQEPINIPKSPIHRIPLKRSAVEEQTYLSKNKLVDSFDNSMGSDATHGVSDKCYSKGIKARLAQLFNSKSYNSSNSLPDQKQIVTNSSARSKSVLHHTQSGLEVVQSRKLSEEQIVAAHHTQLAMITGLCHEEMVLLKERDANKQDFGEYAAHLEDILLQKQACIKSLQEKLANWKK